MKTRIRVEPTLGILEMSSWTNKFCALIVWGHSGLNKWQRTVTPAESFWKFLHPLISLSTKFMSSPITRFFHLSNVTSKLWVHWDENSKTIKPIQDFLEHKNLLRTHEKANCNIHVDNFIWMGEHVSREMLVECLKIGRPSDQSVTLFLREQRWDVKSINQHCNIGGNRF